MSAGPALRLAPDAQAADQAQATVTNYPSVSPLNANAAERYFTEELMRRELGNPASLATPACQVVAYNFPSWHPTPFMEKIFGKGWTEWETLKRAQPLFPGHLMPKYPLWGYFNEADPAWAAKEIDTAAAHGIDVWMIDWYWHSGAMLYHEQLEQGMLRAPNRNKLKFALMWANHGWLNCYPAVTGPRDAAVLLPQLHTQEDTQKAIDYCIEHYFPQPNYWRLGGALVFAIFSVSQMISYLGKDGLKHAIEVMRTRVQKAGLGELHIQASNESRLGPELKNLGFDSATLYHTFSWTYGGRPPGGRSPYGDGAVESIRRWKQVAAKSSVPFFPDCPTGFDDSPRYGAFSHIVSERSPDQFEGLMRAARHFAAATSPKVVFLSAWNEWTEDHVLLPDTIWGYSYLEAVRRAFRT
jgi:hypothetical protein